MTSAIADRRVGRRSSRRPLTSTVEADLVMVTPLADAVTMHHHGVVVIHLSERRSGRQQAGDGAHGGYRLRHGLAPKWSLSVPRMHSGETTILKHSGASGRERRSILAYTLGAHAGPTVRRCSSAASLAAPKIWVAACDVGEGAQCR